MSNWGDSGLRTISSYRLLLVADRGRGVSKKGFSFFET
jgi:hypothetical protein